MSEPGSAARLTPSSQPGSAVVASGVAAVDDEACLVRYCAGDLQAFEELFARHARAVYDFFFFMTDRREQAVQLSQEAWLAVRKHRGELTPGARFLPWLFSQAVQVRRERSPAAAADMAAQDKTSAPAAESSTAAAPGSAEPIHKELAAMADSYREVLVLHRMSGLGFADIAVALGATEAAVKARALQGYFQASDPYDRGSERGAADLSHSRPPLSRCPETAKLINLVVASSEARTAEPLSQLVRHTQDCPLCEVTQAKVESGYQALGKLAARPESAALEQIARVVLPAVARDFAPSRTGWAIVVAVLALLLLVATTAGILFR